MICTTGHGRAIPGQYLVEAFHKQIAAVQTIHPGIEIKLRWMPGHAGIPGNEQAVEEAKGVAKGQLNERRRLPMVCRGEMPCIRSAAQQGHRKMVNNKAKKWFKHSPRCQRLQGIDPSMPSLRFRRDTQGLEHWKASLLVQLRTRHVPLQVHLCRIRKVESPACPKCNMVDKMVSYYLTTCMAFTIQRGHMKRHLRRATKSVSTLLTNPKALPCLLKYIHDPGRFCRSIDDS